MHPLFELLEDRFVPTPWSRGPWNPRFLHGGPPAALLTHLVERERGDSGLFIARIAFDLLRPVGFSPIEGRAATVREGRRIRIVDASLHADGQLVARASALLVRPRDVPEGAVTLPPRAPIPHWSTLTEERWREVEESRQEAFHRGCLIRYVERDWQGRNVVLWVRAPYELLPGRPLSRLEHAAAVADYSNAVGNGSRLPEAPFINADIGLSLFREPAADWVCMQSVGRGDARGIAVSNINLHDAQGFFGHSSATCLANAEGG